MRPLQLCKSRLPWAEFLLGVLVLVHKPGKPRDQVKGYRPITLLNIDIRLLCLVLAQRQHLPLDLLVAATQSAFIGGRDISDNLLFHLGLVDWLRHRHQMCWLLLLDLAGAWLHREEREDWKKRLRSSHQSSNTRQAPWVSHTKLRSNYSQLPGEDKTKREKTPESNHVLSTCVPTAPAAPAPYTGLGPT
jgi:hypothetical protein